MVKFIGLYTYKVDEKGRIPIPPSFRSHFETGGFLTLGPDHNIHVYTKERYEAIAQSLHSDNLPDIEHRKLQRDFYGNSSDFTPDGQGRIPLPQHLREKVNITNSAVVVGVNEYVEIWDPEHYREVSEQTDHWSAVDKPHSRGPA